jgi:hypothetical protein
MGAEIGAAIRRIQNNLSLMLGFYLVPDEPAMSRSSAWPASARCAARTPCGEQGRATVRRRILFPERGAGAPQVRHAAHAYANLPCFLIFDQQFAKSYSLAHLPVGAAVPASVARADTIAGLAAKLGIDTIGLDRTVERLQRLCRDGTDEDFPARRAALAAGRPLRGRPENTSLGALDQPPFYGSSCGRASAPPRRACSPMRNGQVLHQRRIRSAACTPRRRRGANEIGAGYQAGSTSPRR